METPENAAPDPAALGASMAQTMPPVTGAASPAPAPAPAAPSAAASAENDAPAPAYDGKTTPVPGVTRDGRGVPFDPAKHLPKINPKTKGWMPKSPGRHGGAKRLETSPPSRLATEPSLFDSTESSSAARSPSSSRLPGGAVGGSFIPREEDLPPPPSSTQSTPGAGKAEAPNPEPVGGADDVAAVAVDLLSEGVGLLTGAPEEAEPGTKEGARLRDVLGAYLRSKGVETRGVWAVVLAFGAWLLRTAKKPKTRAWVRDQVNRRGEVIDIEPRAPAQAQPSPSPSPEPASAPAPARGAPSYPLNLPRR